MDMDNISAVVEWGLVFSSFWVLLVFLLVLCYREEPSRRTQKNTNHHNPS
jgi:hypothetical protein